VTNVQEWAKEYEARGYALARIIPGAKRPDYAGWTKRSFPAQAFAETDNIGIQSGGRSGNLVCIDLDSREAVAAADRFLPATDMVDGREGKPKSHRWFRVTDIPPELTARPHVGGGVGGPRTRQFLVEKSMAVEWRGTGSQAVVPPSTWTNDDGTRQEKRVWHAFGEPRVMDACELFSCVCRLAEACGWLPPAAPKRKKKVVESCREAALPLIPTTEAASQARAYLAGMPPAVGGQGSNKHTFVAAAVLVVDFGLTVEEAFPILAEWNAQGKPPRSIKDLRDKLDSADKSEEEERGWRLLRRDPIVVHVRPGDERVVVGVGCAREGWSYVELPTMWAGTRKVIKGRELAPELAAVSWAGKHVLLTPPSTITTNGREVWAEFYLSRLLSQRGARVESIRIPPLDGRQRTLAMAEDELIETVAPPQTVAQAFSQATMAGRLARELDPYRRSLPRRKPSPTKEKAYEFVVKYGVTALTKEILKKAKRNGISEDSLRRALGRRKTNTSPHSSLQSR
jgi:hypothetical protein